MFFPRIFYRDEFKFYSIIFCHNSTFPCTESLPRITLSYQKGAAGLRLVIYVWRIYGEIKNNYDWKILMRCLWFGLDPKTIFKMYIRFNSIMDKS